MLPLPPGLSFDDFDTSLLDAPPSHDSTFTIDATRYARGTDRPGFTQRSIKALNWLRAKNAAAAKALIELAESRANANLRNVAAHRRQPDQSFEEFIGRCAEVLAGEVILRWASEKLRPGAPPPTI